MCTVVDLPVHKALTKLTEVLNSTAGPPPPGLPEGCQKGRGDETALREWMSQQQILRSVMADFQSTSRGARRAPRGLGSIPTAHGEWQGKAIEKFAVLRHTQHEFEMSLKVSSSLA